MRFASSESDEKQSIETAAWVSNRWMGGNDVILTFEACLDGLNRRNRRTLCDHVTGDSPVVLV